MTLSWDDATANVFQEVTATITTSGSDARAIYVDWGDGQDPDGNFTHDKRYANYQWITSTEATGSFTAKHTYTASGTFYPVVQVINSDGIASKYYAHGSASGVPKPSISDSIITGNVVSDTAATAIMRTQNKQVKSGIDNSILDEQGATELYISVPPLATDTQLSYVDDITVEVEGIVEYSMQKTASTDESTGVAGASRSLVTKTRTVTHTFGPGYSEVSAGNGGRWKKILKVTWTNPKLASNFLDYDRNEAYNLVKVFFLVLGDDTNYYPLTYLSAGCPIKRADDPQRFITMDFTQSRAAASNVALNKYRYDNGKTWLSPVFQWSTTGANAANPWYFTDDTSITNETRDVSYTYMTNPIGFDGDSDPDKTAWGTGSTDLDWNIDASDNQINRTNQFLIDEFGCFYPQYHFTRLSVQPSSSSTLTGTSMSSLSGNRAAVLRVTPAGLSTMNVATSGAFTKLDVAPTASGNYSADYSVANFQNGSSYPVSISGVNTQTWRSQIDSTTRVENEYLICLFDNKTNKLGFNINPYASDLISTALSGSAPSNPVTMTVSYLKVEHPNTPKQLMYWQELETVDTTKIDWEIRNTTSGAYFTNSCSLTKSGFVSFDMPDDWSAVSLDDMTGGYESDDTSTGLFSKAANTITATNTGSQDIKITGSAQAGGTITNYGKWIKITSLTGDDTSGGAIKSSLVGSADDVGAFRYAAICVNSGTSGPNHCTNKMGWVASGAANGVKSDLTEVYIHYGEEEPGEYAFDDFGSPTAATQWILRKVNIYDVFTGVSKVEEQTGSGGNLPPVDAYGAGVAFPNSYVIKGSPTTTSGTLASGMIANWSQGGAYEGSDKGRKYALKIDISGNFAQANHNIQNIWDATEGHLNVIEQIDDSAYNLNSIPLTAAVGVGRASNLYTAVTRKGKVFIAQTGVPIQTIAFSSVALGDEGKATAFTLNGPGTTYGFLHKVRKLQAESKRVYWDERQKDGTFVRFWGVISDISESRELGGPRAIKNYTFNMIIEEVALLEGDGKLMTDIFPLGGVLSDKTYT